MFGTVLALPSSHGFATMWQSILALIGLWMLWAATGALYSWLRIDFALRRSGIPKGPGFLELLAIAGSPKIHRAIVAWVRKYGDTFWFRMGPVHVRTHYATCRTMPKGIPPTRFVHEDVFGRNRCVQRRRRKRNPSSPRA